MKIRTQLRAGALSPNHAEALQVRTALRAGAGAEPGLNLNHSEVLHVRTALKVGGKNLNHNEALQVRTALKAGGKDLNHNEALRVPTASNCWWWGGPPGRPGPRTAAFGFRHAGNCEENGEDVMRIKSALKAGGPITTPG